jgi:hypothetical protein
MLVPEYWILDTGNKKLGKVKIRVNKETSPNTVQAIDSKLPMDVKMTRWGDELYGSIDVDAEAENPVEECEVGDVAYWLDGPALCILFGRTPASTGPNPKLISPGNIVGKVEAKNMDAFKEINVLNGRLMKAKGN